MWHWLVLVNHIEYQTTYFQCCGGSKQLGKVSYSAACWPLSAHTDSVHLLSVLEVRIFLYLFLQQIEHNCLQSLMSFSFLPRLEELGLEKSL